MGGLRLSPHPGRTLIRLEVRFQHSIQFSVASELAGDLSARQFRKFWTEHNVVTEVIDADRDARDRNQRS